MNDDTGKDELDEIENILHDGVRDGLYEVAEENDNHQSRYKLTNFGEVEAQRTIATKGLPFLVMVSSRKAVEDGKARTVKSMADEIIAKFPRKLKQSAKENFAPFWSEYAGWAPEEYLAAYDEAQS